MKRTRISIIFLILIMSSLLAACTGTSIASSWPGVNVDQKVVYVAEATRVYAVNLNDGTMIWRYPEKPSKNFYAKPAIINNQVIVGDYSNTLYSLNAATGAENWTFPGAKDRFIGPPLVFGDLILAPNADHNLYAVNQQGKLQWSFKTGGPVWAQPVSDGKTVYSASMDGFLYALNPADGTKIWNTNLGSAVEYSLTISDDKTTLFAGTISGDMIAVDAANGKVIWKAKAAGNIWASSVQHDDAIFFGDQAGKMYALSVKDGSVRWSGDAGSAVTGSAQVIDKGVVFPTENNGLVAVDFSGNKLWNLPVNGKLYSSLAFTGDRLVVAVTKSADNQLLVSVNPSGVLGWSFIPPK